MICSEYGRLFYGGPKDKLILGIEGVACSTTPRGKDVLLLSTHFNGYVGVTPFMPWYVGQFHTWLTRFASEVNMSSIPLGSLNNGERA